MTMVERVARALKGGHGGDWENYIPDARIAIVAMREPTEAMMKAAWKSSLGGSIRLAERSYLAAIDAALDAKA